MPTRILLLDVTPPASGKQLSVDIANEPGTEAPNIVVYDGKTYRRWVELGLGKEHLRDGDQYVLTSSAEAKAAK